MSNITYNPNVPWPAPVLAKFIQIREKQGFHLIYKNGYHRNYDYERKLSDFKSITNGWTARIFMLRVNMSETAAMHIIYDGNYFGTTYIPKNGGEGIVSEQKGKDRYQYETLVPKVQPGDVFSIGMRVILTARFPYLQGAANDASGPWMNVGTLVPNDWTFKIWQRSHLLLSMHITCEYEEGTEIYLPDYYDIPDSQQPPGSSMISRLEVKDVNTDLYLRINPGDGVKYENYGRRKDVANGSLIYVYIRNLPDRYVMTTSFDPQPRTILHQEDGKRNIWFHRGGSLITLSTTHYILLDQ